MALRVYGLTTCDTPLNEREFNSIKQQLIDGSVPAEMVDGRWCFRIYRGFKFYRSETKDKRKLRRLKRRGKI